MFNFPSIFRVRQIFARPRVADIAGEVHAQLARLELHRRVQAGQSVAITAGSRGIANIAVILRAAVEHFRSLGAEPFLVPAMGSHGGGTAEGQRQVLESYGITEASVGCPIRASMETAIVGRAAEGFPLHVDRAACAADHVLVCGRVKPHTGLAGEFQSGLLKMLLIGLGKQAGANIYHRAVEDYSFDQHRAQRGRRGLAEVPRRGGTGHRGKRLRRNGTGSRPSSRRSSKPASRSCSPWPASGWPGCRSTRSTCC